MKHHWNSKGYDSEELYFEKVNRELINELKKQKSPSGETEGTKVEASAEIIPFERPQKQKKAA